jgi:CRP-like cAMP-binding protein
MVGKSKRKEGSRGSRNLVLQAMPAETLARLAQHIEPVVLQPARVLCDPGAAIQHVYFPQTCVLSLLAVSESGDAVEAATVGREGAFDLFAGMPNRQAIIRCLVQLGGRAERIAAARFRQELERSPQARIAVTNYIEALFVQVQQSVLCNALHAVEARLSRWLLAMHDRADGDRLPLTQEFLAGMLGASRTTVTSAARALQAAGAIRYRRGRVDVVDRTRLEDASCECYAVVRRHFERIFPPERERPARSHQQA